MRIFTCPECGGPLQFDSLTCLCGIPVAFDPDAGHFVVLASGCANRIEISCNWVAHVPNSLCGSCTMTEVVPDTFHNENRFLWMRAEHTKRWVLANLTRWGWFKSGDGGPRPVFHLLAEQTSGGFMPISMGHADGVVTINVTEADPVERIQRREALGETLRTMTAHFRHELGHFFFICRLSQQPGFADNARALFGDEREDYGAALSRYYDIGPSGDWNSTHVTPYASSHPHEDWAETFAHLLHLTDIVDSFVAAGFHSDDLPLAGYDPYLDQDASQLISTGAGLGIGLNHVNRSMGLPDIYPFVLTETTRAKLAFIHGWMKRAVT
jgi:hypothetical protein